MIESVALVPPLAISRFGGSDTPLSNFGHSAPDTRPRGTNKIRVEPLPTLHVRDDGSVEEVVPNRVDFKDEAGFRPVAPFVELFGKTAENSDLHVLTAVELTEAGFKLSQITWTIWLGNAKAYHYTLKDDDYYSCKISIKGNDHNAQDLFAFSSPDTKNPLVFEKKPIPVGRFQVIRPTIAHNQIRARYTPPKGLVYGPTDLAKRATTLELPKDQCILNPKAPWCQWDRRGSYEDESDPLWGDGRNNPSELYVGVPDPDHSREAGPSIGIIDDMVDGLIEVRIGKELRAVSRLAVSPPDFAPDRRPFVSLADGLKDRVDRLDELDTEFFDDEEAIEAIVRDLFERVFETMANSNMDAQNERSGLENARIAESLGLPSPGPVWPVSFGPTVDELPLSQTGRRRHRRINDFEILKARVRDGTVDLAHWVRPPLADSPYYDEKMPALMRGSDRRPMHVTRRQHRILMRWQEMVRES